MDGEPLAVWYLVVLLVGLFVAGFAATAWGLAALLNIGWGPSILLLWAVATTLTLMLVPCLFRTAGPVVARGLSTAPCQAGSQRRGRHAR